MRSKKDIFQDSGPFHITNIDWNDANHRRSIMASLLMGVKVLECDQQLKNEGSEAQAPAWWKHFHFELREQLKLEDDNNTQNHIIGAIFEFMSPTTKDHPDEVPRFVIALRGTLLKRDTCLADIKEDYRILINKLHQSSRYQHALSCVEEKVHSVGVKKVWLAGYSLGAAITLLVGKEMARQGLPLETYLFNPPFVSLSLEWMKSSKLRLGVHIIRTIARATLAFGKSKLGDLKADRYESKGSNYDPFATIKNWEPHLFLNSNDFICSGYIGYFKTRKVMRTMKKLKDLEKRATRETIIRGLLTGEWDKEQEPIHLLASGKLIINKEPSSNITEAHKIQQWWNHQLNFKNKSFQY